MTQQEVLALLAARGLTVDDEGERERLALALPELDRMRACVHALAGDEEPGLVFLAPSLEIVRR